MAVSIVIPVKDEPYLPTLLSEIEAVLVDRVHEVLVISGNGQDSNRHQSSNAQFITNYADSLERAILTGFTTSKYDKIIVMDGDGQHPPSIIPQIIDGLEDNDLVVASRFAEGASTEGLSPYRRTISKTYTHIAKGLGINKDVSDPMSGFFGVKRRIIEQTDFKPFKWKILCEILLKNQKLRVTEVPYTFQKRSTGSSTVSTSTALGIIWDMISVSKRLQIIARIGITIGIFALLSRLLNLELLYTTLLNIRLEYLLYSTLCYAAMTLLMGYRIQHVLIRLDEKVSFKNVFYAHTFGMLSSNIGFGKIGYLSSVPVLKNNSKVESDKGLSAILGIQGIEMLVKGFVASISIILLLLFTDTTLYILTPALIGVGSILLFGGVGMALLFVKPYWLEDVPVLGKIAGYFKSHPAFKKTFPFIVVTSLICWVFRGAEWYFIGSALGLNIPFAIYMAMHPLLTSIKFLPLTPSSIGVFEIAIIWGMGAFGITPELGTMFGLLDRFDNVIDLVAIKELFRLKR